MLFRSKINRFFTKKKPPTPLFDSVRFVDGIAPPTDFICPDDFKKAQSFLKCYTGSIGTFNSYRRELERLLQWSCLVVQKPLQDLKREDIEDFIQFCKKPPQSWIGTKKVARFVGSEDNRKPNHEWRPFVATVSKSAFKKGEAPTIKDFVFSNESLKETFAILSSFFNYLIQEEYVLQNPVALIRQKSKFIQKNQGMRQIRRLSSKQWQYVLNTAKQMALREPASHERTLFILSILYGMYLRISELAANQRWSPAMNHFIKDDDGNWWFITVGKGNKKRQIAVSDSVLESLKRWRTHLKLSPLPTPADSSPLIPKTKGSGPISHTNYIRVLVQRCFDEAIAQLKLDNYVDESEALMEATVHWLRHTGISDDVKIRPREHVRDDAGHSSSAITDRYINIELKERHASAKSKPLE